MFDRIWCNYENNQFAKKPSRILCTISGGQDSIVNFFLIFSLLYFQQQKRLRKKIFVEKKINQIKVLYCNHFWQIKNFFLTFFIFRVSFFFQIPFFVVLAEHSFLNENRSRGWRKKTFYRVCQLERITALVTGHTETDTVEKNFNNLFRGTSAKGLTDFDILCYQKNHNIFFSNLLVNSSSRFKLFNFSKQSAFFFYNKKSNKGPRITNSLTLLTTFSFFQIEKKALKKVFYDNKTFGYTNNRIGNKNSLFSSDLKSISFCFYSKTINQKVNFNKPLQTICRSTISELVTFFKLPLLIDFTNYSSNFSRNKIRHEIFPFVKSRYHKKVENLVGNFFQTIGIDHEEIDRQTVEIFFLYKILPLIYFQNLQLSRNSYLPVTLERSFLQKMLVDYKNVDLIFSQLLSIQNQVFKQ